MCKQYIVDSNSFAMFILPFGYYHPLVSSLGVYVIQKFYVCFGKGLGGNWTNFREKKKVGVALLMSRLPVTLHVATEYGGRPKHGAKEVPSLNPLPAQHILTKRLFLALTCNASNRPSWQQLFEWQRMSLQLPERRHMKLATIGQQPSEVFQQVVKIELFKHIITALTFT